MSDCIRLLDEALDKGERELDLLAEGDVEGAEALAADRDRLLSSACENYGSVEKSEILDRLMRLKELQGHITAEALRLRQELRSKLGRTKKEARRMAGYSGAVRPRPVIANRFLNREG